MNDLDKCLNKRQILNNYKKFCGKKIINELCARAKKLNNKNILFISSTYHGGGVAEILNSLVVLFNIIGIKVGWRVLNGSDDFFKVTKKFHNALQGERINLSKNKKRLYCITSAKFALITHIYHDLVVVHDPQPLPLINFYKKSQPWIFRCHIDLSNPNTNLLKYLKQFIKKYNRIIFSKKEYQQPTLTNPISIIAPAIDPLTVKNMYLNKKTIKATLIKYGIPVNKPIIAQVSRFDKWKDPIGVIKIFEKVRETYNCSLILLGSLASDDPEGQSTYDNVIHTAKASKYAKDIKVLLVSSDILVNCVQRAATVVIQKSLREGFGLVVSEALLKGTPVVASNVGGIPLQVIDGVNGYIIEPYDVNGFANRILLILQNKDLKEQLGQNGIEHVKNNYLITRLMTDWMSIFESCLGNNK